MYIYDQLEIINICFDHHLQDAPVALVAEYMHSDSKVVGLNPTWVKIYFFIFFCFCDICPKKLISITFVYPKHSFCSI